MHYKILTLLIGITCSLAPLFSSQEEENKSEKTMERPPLTPDQLLTVQETIFHFLKGEEAKLLEIQSSPLPLVQKWQMFLSILLPIQKNILKNFGLGEEQLAISQFNQQFMEQAAKNPILRRVNQQKWEFLFEKAFGLKTAREISLEEARSLVAGIVRAMTGELFLQEIDQIAAQFDENTSLVTKRQALLTVLFPLHMAVMAQHGFEGERGYIEAQRAMMEYTYDPEIMQGVTEATTIVFKRAKLL